MLHHLRTLGLKKFGFRSRRSEYVEHGFSVSDRRLGVHLSAHRAA